MKTLEQLRISPVPWTNMIKSKIHFETNSVLDANNGGILTGGYYESLNDARLIAAAPELYAALFEMVEMHRDGGSYDYEQEVIKKAKAALAKAAGESEVEK